MKETVTYLPNLMLVLESENENRLLITRKPQKKSRQKFDPYSFFMSDVQFKKHRVFRETEDVIFYDISVDESNSSDLVVHTGAAISPPNDLVGAKQFYIHGCQDDYNRVVSCERQFELVNFDWKYPYHIVRLNVHSGALIIPKNTYHRSQSGEEGSIVINQAKRYEGFDSKLEFIPVSAAEVPELYKVLLHEKPVIHTLGE